MSYDKTSSPNDNKKETQEPHCYLSVFLKPSLFLTEVTFTISEHVFVSRKGLHSMLILKLHV